MYEDCEGGEKRDVHYHDPKADQLRSEKGASVVRPSGGVGIRLADVPELLSCCACNVEEEIRMDAFVDGLLQTLLDEKLRRDGLYADLPTREAAHRALLAARAPPAGPAVRPPEIDAQSSAAHSKEKSLHDQRSTTELKWRARKEDRQEYMRRLEDQYYSQKTSGVWSDRFKSQAPETFKADSGHALEDSLGSHPPSNTRERRAQRKGEMFLGGESVWTEAAGVGSSLSSTAHLDVLTGQLGASSVGTASGVRSTRFGSVSAATNRRDSSRREVKDVEPPAPASASTIFKHEILRSTLRVTHISVDAFVQALVMHIDVLEEFRRQTFSFRVSSLPYSIKGSITYAECKEKGIAYAI